MNLWRLLYLFQVQFFQNNRKTVWCIDEEKSETKGGHIFTFTLDISECEYSHYKERREQDSISYVN